MQISEISENIIKKVCKLLKNKISCLYIPDSLGSLTSKQVIHKNNKIRNTGMGILECMLMTI